MAASPTSELRALGRSQAPPSRTRYALASRFHEVLGERHPHTKIRLPQDMAPHMAALTRLGSDIVRDLEKPAALSQATAQLVALFHEDNKTPETLAVMGGAFLDVVGGFAGTRWTARRKQTACLLLQHHIQQLAGDPGTRPDPPQRERVSGLQDPRTMPSASRASSPRRSTPSGAVTRPPGQTGFTTASEHFKRGKTHLSRHKPDRALDAFAQAVHTLPEDVEYQAYKGWATYLCDQKSLSRVRANLRRLLSETERGPSISPHKVAQLHLILGRLFKADAKPKRAFEHFHRAAGLDSNCLEAVREERIYHMNQNKGASQSWLQRLLG